VTAAPSAAPATPTPPPDAARAAFEGATVPEVCGHPGGVVSDGLVAAPSLALVLDDTASAYATWTDALGDPWAAGVVSCVEGEDVTDSAVLFRRSGSDAALAVGLAPTFLPGRIVELTPHDGGVRLLYQPIGVADLTLAVQVNFNGARLVAQEADDPLMLDAAWRALDAVLRKDAAAIDQAFVPSGRERARAAAAGVPAGIEFTRDQSTCVGEARSLFSEAPDGPYDELCLFRGTPHPALVTLSRLGDRQWLALSVEVLYGE